MLSLAFVSIGLEIVHFLGRCTLRPMLADLGQSIGWRCGWLHRAVGPTIGACRGKSVPGSVIWMIVH